MPIKQGRPAKVAVNDDSSNHRREKMRDLQRAFRKRKEGEQADMQHRIAMLEDTVDHMTSTFIGMSDLIVSSGFLKEQPDRAVAIKQQMSRFLTLAERAAGDADHSTDESRHSSSQESVEYANDSKNDDVSSTVAGSKSIKATPSKPLERSNMSGSFSPNLTYAMLPQNISLLSYDAPGKIMARCAAGQDSFLSRLYWSITVSSLHALRGEAPDDARIKFQYSMNHCDPDSLVRKAYRSMQFMLYGQEGVGACPLSAWSGLKRANQTRLLAEDADLVAKLRAAIELDMQQAGRTDDEYINSTELEYYLSSHWGITPGTDTLRLLLPTEILPNLPMVSMDEAVPSLDPLFDTAVPTYWQPQLTNAVNVLGPLTTVQSGSNSTNGDFASPPNADASKADALSAAPAEVTLGMEKLMAGLNLASVCFGNEMRLEKQAVDRAAMAVFEQAVYA